MNKKGFINKHLVMYTHCLYTGVIFLQIINLHVLYIGWYFSSWHFKIFLVEYIIECFDSNPVSFRDFNISQKRSNGLKSYWLIVKQIKQKTVFIMAV